MNRIRLIAILGSAFLSLNTLNAPAQQTAAPGSKTPTLTSGDVPGLLRVKGTRVAKDFDPARWSRYTPAGLSISLDLPGGLRPLEQEMPDILVDWFSRDCRDTKYFSAATNSLIVSVLYLPTNKRVASQADLKARAAQFGKFAVWVFARAFEAKTYYDVKLTGTSNASLSMKYDLFGASFELAGAAHSRGRDIWLVTAEYYSSDETARAAARRILSSVGE